MRAIDEEMQTLADMWGIRARGRGGELYQSILEQLTPIPQGTSPSSYFHYLMLYEDELGAEQQQALDRYRYLNNLMTDRNALEKEYADTQEKITRMQEAQQRLRFLEQQVNLLKLIDKHGLDAADILGGLKLGADASAEAVLEATTRAMEQIILQAEEKLGLRSPSTVFRKFGQQLMEGMALGIEDMMSLPVRQSAILARSMVSAPAAASIGSYNVNNARTVNVNAGGNQFYTGMDETRYSSRTTRAVSRALRGW